MTVLNFNANVNKYGKLIAIESQKNIFFDIKRVFYIYSADINSKRGKHAHFKTTQCLISVSGSCTVCLDNGLGFQKEYKLDSPEKYLIQDPLIWGSMYNFSQDNVLLVMADTYFSEDDYIKSYDDFLKIVNN